MAAATNTDDLFYNEEALQQSAYARIMLSGQPKCGKTTTILTTAPGPIDILNCDGPGAQIAAKRFGAKNLSILDVTTPELWEKGVRAVIRRASEGKCNTVVVDTFTLLVNNVLAMEMGKRYEKWDIWRETLQSAMGGLNALIQDLQAHLFLVVHYDMNDGLVNIKGQTKKDLPGMVHDRVHMEYRHGKDPARVYHVGSSADGMSGGRFSGENKMIPADATLLLKELGYNVD